PPAAGWPWLLSSRGLQAEISWPGCSSRGASLRRQDGLDHTLKKGFELLGCQVAVGAKVCCLHAVLLQQSLNRVGCGVLVLLQHRQENPVEGIGRWRGEEDFSSVDVEEVRKAVQ